MYISPIAMSSARMSTTLGCDHKDTEKKKDTNKKTVLTLKTFDANGTMAGSILNYL